MKRAGRSVAWKKIVLVIVIGALVFTGYRYLYPAQPADIFLATEPLTYGATEITGILQAGILSDGGTQSIIVTPSGALIELDVVADPQLVGRTVSVQGVLSQPTVVGGAPYMQVTALYPN